MEASRLMCAGSMPDPDAGRPGMGVGDGEGLEVKPPDCLPVDPKIAGRFSVAIVPCFCARLMMSSIGRIVGLRTAGAEAINSFA